MKKRFNITTTCIPEEHYMVDISNKLEKIEEKIDLGLYFTINRARQYGKTTVMGRLYNTLQYKYIMIAGSLEGFGEATYETEEKFSKAVLEMINEQLIFQDNELSEFLDNYIEKCEDLKSMSSIITKLCMKSKKEIVLMIDEVDKACNHIIFLDFLAILRDKYNKAKINVDKTFKSVILAGVHDIKNIKVHIKERRLLTEKEAKLIDKTMYNSPWNVADDFKVEMSFNSEEISTMLIEYEKDNNAIMDIKTISQEIYKNTSGYPFLVSKICKLINEELERDFTKKGIEKAINILLKEKNTLFDSLIKNLENDKELYLLIQKVAIDGEKITFNRDEPVINKAEMYGIIKAENGKVAIHNIIFEIRISNYMISKKEVAGLIKLNYETESQFFKKGRLDIVKVLNKFQEFMYEEYRNETQEFVEKEGRLIFLCFIKPIINGVGFYYVEPETRTNKRIDVVITYGNEKFIIELKKWYGKEYEEKGHKQLEKYLDIQKEEKGYMVMFDFRKEKEYTQKWINQGNKQIYEIVV